MTDLSTAASKAGPADFFVRLAQRWMPDAFVVAIVLTAFTFVLSVGVAGYSPHNSIAAWGDGFWDLLTFTNQVVLTLLFGYALAHTKPMVRALNWAASRAKSAGGAYLLVGFVSCIAAAFSWALCLVAGAIMARRTAAACEARGIAVHYPLLVATGYSGIAVWHQGLSSSIGLAIATSDHFLETAIGVIPISETLFTAWNLAALALIVATLPFVMRALAPGPEAVVEMPAGETHHELEDIEPPVEDDAHKEAPAVKAENSPILAYLLVAAGVYYIITHFIVRGDGLNLNTLNFCFLILGVAFAGTPKRYLALIMDAAKVCSPFLLQYPLYAGIAGMMAQSGLAEMIVNLFVRFSTAETLPLWTFLSGGLLNMFIPSGGGQWAIQGPIATAAALELGADMPKVVMAVAWGDQWTNLVQPLVALPALAVAGLHMRDIMGYTLVALLFTALIFLSVLALI
ncbi:MAG: short-chain fatty acid transporter [Maricaulaceae bacterium]